MTEPRKTARRLGRRDLLRAAALAPLALQACAGGVLERVEGAVPRNLLLLVSDDQSRVDVGAFGNRSCTTPNIDRLASEGRIFHRAYTPVSICHPSRCSLYTGLYPQHHGALGFEPIREGVPTWPDLLRAADCATGLIGKLNPQQTDTFRFDHLDVLDNRDPAGRDPERFASSMARFLEEVGDRRFAMIVNFHDPHRPFPERGSKDGVTAEVLEPHDPEKVEVHPFLVDTPVTREELAAYYDAVRRMDEAVGAILEVLDSSGAGEDTLVLFLSDNGTPFPFGKATLYEAGINLPLVARWPGVIEPGESSAIVSLIDILPTALEAFGVEPPPLDGVSILPLLRGDVDRVRDEVFAFHSSHKRDTPYPSRAVVTERYKYVLNLWPHDRPFATNSMVARAGGGRPTADFSPIWKSWEALARDDEGLSRRLLRLKRRPREELYDLSADPDELVNRIDDESLRETRGELRARLRDWMEQMGDPLLARWPR